MGNRLRGSLQGHVRIRDRRSRNRRRNPRARSPRHQTALCGRSAGTATVRLDRARPARRRRGRHRTRPPRTAPLHELSLRGARTAHHLPRRAQAAAGDRAGDPARRCTRRHALLDTAFRARSGASVLDQARLAGGVDGRAAYGGGTADGRRRPRRRPAVRRHRLVYRGCAAGRAGPARPGHIFDRIRLGW